jgi:hypothetical protein
MSNPTIIFGTKKLGKEAAGVVSEKYPDLAVITVEGQKEAKKSRRILLNTKAAELLSAEVGFTQRVIFASVEVSDDADKQVLIANFDLMPEQENQDDVVTYKTSKNKVSFSDDSKEKGKAITSSQKCGDIFSFLNLDDSSNVEFELKSYDSDEFEAFSLKSMNDTSDDVIETNGGSMNGEDLQKSIKQEVASAEVASPILQKEECAVEDSVEKEEEEAFAGLQSRQQASSTEPWLEN